MATFGELTEARRTLITTALILSTLLTSVASTIANVVLPQIRSSTGAAQDQITWVLTSFILAGVIVTPAIGWLEERIGRRRLLLGAMIGYTASSLLCGIATDIFEMVGFRLLQGAFGAVFVPMSQAILLDINPPERHGRAMSIWGMGAVFGPIVGPVLGGWLAENLSWRWVFFVNIPLAAIAFTLVAMFLHDREKGPPARFDAFGFGAIALAVASFQLMLDRGPGREWFAAPEIWIYLALALTGVYAYALHTFTATRAIFDRSILGDRNFITAAVMIVFIGVLMFAGQAVLPTLLQSLLGYPVMHSGLVQITRGIGSLLSMFLVGRLMGRVDSRALVIVGLALTAWSYFVMSQFALGMDETLVLISGLLQGGGLGLIFVPLSALAFTTISPRLRTEAASLFTLIRNVGSSAGISMVGALQIFNTRIVQSQLSEHLTPGDQNAAAAGVNFADAGTIASLSHLLGRQASMVAYIDTFHLLFLMSILIAPLVFLIRSKRPNPLPA